MAHYSVRAKGSFGFSRTSQKQSRPLSKSLLPTSYFDIHSSDRNFEQKKREPDLLCASECEVLIKKEPEKGDVPLGAPPHIPCERIGLAYSTIRLTAMT